MSAHDLKTLLDGVPDTRELVLRHGEPIWNEVYAAWSDAHEDAELAYLEWRRTSAPVAYATYRAAQDREDAAQDALAAYGSVSPRLMA
jgi:hypothetical protein